MFNEKCGWRWGCKGAKANLGRRGGINRLLRFLEIARAK
jgi:hypothetical protein